MSERNFFELLAVFVAILIVLLSVFLAYKLVTFLIYIIKKLAGFIWGSARTDEVLLGRLQGYYKDHVDIPGWEMRKARQVADDIKGHLRDFVRQHASTVQFWDTGSTTEGLKVISPDEFDVMVVVDAEVGDYYKYVIEQPKYLSGAAGFYNVRRRERWFVNEAMSTATKWTDPGARCMVDGYLSPEEVRRSFKSMMDHAFRGFTNYDVRRKEQGPSVMLEVAYFDQGQRKRLSIDFVPAYKFDEKVLVAKPHPMSFYSNDYSNLWRVSYSREERTEVQRYADHGDCKVKCLKILKAVRVNRHAEFGMLSSYVLKTAWLHLVDNEYWREDDLPHYFTLLLKRLKMYLESGDLPHYFDSNVNVLSGLSESERTHAVRFLNNELSKGSFENLLKIYRW